MNIKIKVSDSMARYSGMYVNENRMLRIPKLMREHLGFEIGHQLQMHSTNGIPIVLCVGTAYKVDVDTDDNICYVTKQIFNLLNVEGTENYKITPITDITLGCDPEFFLIDRTTKKILRADKFFRKWGEIGCDGILAELRPKPSIEPRELTDTIYKLILNTRDMLNINTVYDPNQIMMYAASGHQSATAGFHLHFGLPKDILGSNPTNIVLMQQIVKVLDYYVGVPAIMLEGEADASRRANMFVNYGKPSDFRLDNRTLEYRVAGGNMLRHPILTNGLLALGGVVVQDIISRVKLSTNGFRHLYWAQREERFRQFYPNVLNTSDVYGLICSPTIGAAKRHLDSIYTGIKNMIGYEKRREDIDAFFSHIYTDTQYDNNIEYNWRTFYDKAAKLHYAPDQKTAVSTGS